jgi:sulfite exporter TauE/SafE
MTGWAVALVVTAVAGAPHCAGMCGALACAAGTSWREQVPYHAGRTATYAALGALAGGFGQVLDGYTRVGTWVAIALLVVMSASIAGLVPEPRIASPGLTRAAAALLRRRTVLSRLGFGLVNGLLPCGLLYAALAVPVGLGSALGGAAAMVLFGVLTAPALVAATLGARQLLERLPGGRYAVAAVVRVFGVGSLLLRVE